VLDTGTRGKAGNPIEWRKSAKEEEEYRNKTRAWERTITIADSEFRERIPLPMVFITRWL
jgi:hypothetical protein